MGKTNLNFTTTEIKSVESVKVGWSKDYYIIFISLLIPHKKEPDFLDNKTIKIKVKEDNVMIYPNSDTQYPKTLKKKICSIAKNAVKLMKSTKLKELKLTTN